MITPVGERNCKVFGAAANKDKAARVFRKERRYGFAVALERDRDPDGLKLHHRRRVRLLTCRVTAPGECLEIGCEDLFFIVLFLHEL